MKQQFDDVPEWTFEINEVSANVYLVVGTDTAGHRVERKGTDPDELLLDARRGARKIQESVKR